MQLDAVTAKVDGILHMTAEQGRKVYEHVRATRPLAVLEVGTANAVGTSYIAAALEENGDGGRVTTLDRTDSDYQPGPDKVLADVGLAHLVERVRTPDTSYNWWLKKQIQARSDAAGNCEPVYDFVFLDGAHEFNIDGLAVVLLGKLLKPGGWLLLDDMAWTFGADPGSPRPPHISEEELAEPHIQAAFDVLVKTDPSFTELREDGEWGWARKAPGEPRRMTLEVQTQTRALGLAKALRRAVRRGRSG